MTVLLVLFASLVCGVAAGLTLVILTRDRARSRAEIDRIHAEAEIRLAEVQLEEAKRLTSIASRGDLVEAAQVCNKYGFLVLRQDEVPAAAERLGYHSIPNAKWEALLAAVRHRTNITAEIDRKLVKEGLIEKPKHRQSTRPPWWPGPFTDDEEADNG